MVEKVVIDPLTRIEGHLRIEMETEGEQIKKAWSVSTQGSRLSSKIAILGMYGPSSNVFVGFALRFTRLLPLPQ